MFKNIAVSCLYLILYHFAFFNLKRVKKISKLPANAHLCSGPFSSLILYSFYSICSIFWQSMLFILLIFIYLSPQSARYNLCTKNYAVMLVSNAQPKSMKKKTLN
jgi:hypothetical protein